MPPRLTDRNLVTAAVMLAVSLSAVDVTVVGTAMPTIVGELGGFALYSWVFSGYLLTSTATVPVYGRLADLFGRKPVFAFCTGLFVLGSALCGTAAGMKQLIVFRALQGLGAGGLFPVATTIIGDIYPLEARARVEGLLNSVWAVASVAGPALGGLIVDHLSWRWIFYLNLPGGGAALVLMWMGLQEKIERHEVRLDYPGPILLTAGAAALLEMLTLAGRSRGWESGQVIALAALSSALLAAFVYAEARAAAPMLPLGLFSNRTIAAAGAGQFLVGGVLFGFASYVPLFVRAQLGGSATAAGFSLAPISLGWPMGALLSGRLMIRSGFRRVTVTGTALILAGTAILFSLGTRLGFWGVAFSMLVAGLGFGLAVTCFIISVQNAVRYAERGIATAATEFFSTMGGSLWVALMGGVANAALGAFAPGSIERMIHPVEGARLASAQVLAMRTALGGALSSVFLIALGLAAAALAAACFFPGGLPGEAGEREPTNVAAD